MLGVPLLAVAFIWGAITWNVAKLLCKPLQGPLAQKLTRHMLFLSLMLAPIGDEILGGIQFAYLCSIEEVTKYENLPADGVVSYETSIEKAQDNTLLPTTSTEWRFINPETGNLAYTYKSLSSLGGFLVRKLHITQFDRPILFGYYCQAKDLKKFQSDQKIKVIDKPKK